MGTAHARHSSVGKVRDLAGPIALVERYWTGKYSCTRQRTTTCAGSIGTQRQPSCSSGAKQAADDDLRAPTMAGAPELCLPTLKLAQVSLPARPRPRSVLLCVPAPCLSSTAQPDHRLHSVGGRRLSDAALGPTLDSCPAAACGSSMAARRSSRRRPWCHRGVRQWPERAAFDVRTAVCRRACRSPPAGRSARTHYRAEGPSAPL